MQPENDWPELSRDALDPVATPDTRGWFGLPRRRPVFGAGAIAAPTFIFLLMGVVLGPQGINLLSHGVLGHLDPVVSVALAVIGVFVGLGVANLAGQPLAATLAGGLTTVLVTIVIVTAGLYTLMTAWGVALPLEALTTAAVVGICSSASAAVHVSAHAGDQLRRAARLADVDDVPIVLLGAAAVALVAGASVAPRLLLTVAAGAATGFAGWLLFERARDTAERGVFVTGAILLLAGVGAYLGTSPLLSGGVAAVVWVNAPGAADRLTSDDLRVLQHPLAVLLLIVAGALIEWTPLVLWTAAATVLLRLIAKLLASLVVGRIASISPALLAHVLLPPGIMGIALALNVRQVLGSNDMPLVAIVTVAAITSEILAAFLPTDHEAAA